MARAPVLLPATIEPNAPTAQAVHLAARSIAALLAHGLLSKYADHTRLYSLSQIYAPPAQAIGRHVLAAAKIHTDPRAGWLIPSA